MDIQTESPANTSSAPVVEASLGGGTIPAVDGVTQMGMPEIPMAALPEVKPLTGMEALGTPGVDALKATQDVRAAEVAAAKVEQPPKANPIKRLFGAMGFTGRVTTETLAPASPPDHLTTNANGVLETPSVTNLNGATAEGPSAPKFAETPTPQPDVVTEVVEGTTPSLGTAPAIDTDPLSTASETAAEPAAEPETQTAAVVIEPEAPADFTPSADVAPAEEVDALPEPTPPVVAEPVAEEALPVGQSADANDEAVQAGPGASSDGQSAQPDWSVNAQVHPDAPVVPGHEDSVNSDEQPVASATALADGAAAAAERPPFSDDALNQPVAVVEVADAATADENASGPTGEVGHDIPMEVIASEAVAAPEAEEVLPETVGKIGETPESISDSSIEPTAPTLSTPESMSPTNPLDASTSISSGVGMVDSASALSTGMPEPTPLSAKAENDILDAAEKSWNNPPPAEQVAIPAVSVVDQAANVVVGTGFGSENQNASTAGSIEVPDNASLSGEMPEPVLAGASSATGPDDQNPSEVSPLNQ